MLGFTIMDSSTEAALLKLGHVDAAARRARHPRRAGPVLGGDHPLLPDRGARRLPSGQDADRPDPRHAGDGRRVLPADLQPRRAVGRRRLDLHQGRSRSWCSRSSSPAWCWRSYLRVHATRRRTPRSAASAERRSPHEHARRTARPAPARAAERGRGQRRERDPEDREGLGADRALRVRQPARAAQGRRCRPGEHVAREAFVVLYEKAERKTYEAVVSLTDEAVVSFEHIEGVQPPVMAEEFMACEAVVQSRPGVAGGDAPARGRGLLAGDGRPVGRGLHRAGGRSVRAPDRAAADVGALGAGRARLRAADRGPGGRPSTSTRWRSSRSTTTASSPLPPKPGNYDVERMAAPDNVPSFAAPRPDLKPIAITQPEGRQLHGQRATTSTGRSGACASASRRARASSCTSSPTTGGRSSTALRWRRCSSPTATPRPRTASRTSSTRASTASAGWRTRSRSGCDCVGEIFYFDGVVNDQDGEPAMIANAICMHEEDYGIGWKHTDFRTEDVEVRRLRRLVISLDRHRRQLRVRVLLVPLHRRHDRVRGQAHGRDLDRRAGAGRAARARHAGRARACTGRTTSTSSACGWTWPSTATRTPSCRSTPSRCRGARRTRPARRG